MRRALPAALTALLLGALAAPATAGPAPTPTPSDPAYTLRDLQNIADAYGRVDGAGGQLQNPAYLPALVAASTRKSVDQLLTQVASPTHPALTAGNLVPGWNVGNPMRERATGYDAWRSAGVDSMLVVPRASTHLEYTDIPLVLPASRYGQDLTSVYVQRWLDRYLKHRDNTGSLLGTSFRYLEPTGNGEWSPVRLQRDDLLSFYYCSAYGIHTPDGLESNGDVAGVGC